MRLDPRTRARLVRFRHDLHGSPVYVDLLPGYTFPYRTALEIAELENSLATGDNPIGCQLAEPDGLTFLPAFPAGRETVTQGKEASMTTPKTGHPRPDRFAGLSPIQLGWIMLASLQYVKDARRGEANPIGLVAAYIDGQEAAAILDKYHLHLTPRQKEIKDAIQRRSITTDDRNAIDDGFNSIPSGVLCKLSEAGSVQTLGDASSDFALAATRRLEQSLLEETPKVDFDKDPEEPGDLS